MANEEMIHRAKCMSELAKIFHYIDIYRSMDDEGRLLYKGFRLYPEAVLMFYRQEYCMQEDKDAN